MGALCLGALLLAPPPAQEPPDPREDPKQEDPNQNDVADGDGMRRTVVVTGTATERSLEDSVVKTDVIDRERIEQTGARTVAEALEEEPGLQLDRGIFGGGISLMGLDPAYTLILVDGRRANGRIGGTIDLDRFTVEGLEQVEIVRGASSVLYGSDALAGVVNLRTRRPTRKLEANARLSAGTVSTYDADGYVGGRWGKWLAAGHGGYHVAGAYDLSPQDEGTTGDRQELWNAGLVAGVHPWRNFEIDTTVDYSRVRSTGIDATATGAVFDRTNLTETFTAAAHTDLSRPNGRFLARGSYTVFRDQFLSDQRGSDDLDQFQDTIDQIGQVTVQTDLKIGGHVFTAGADVQAEVLQTDRIDPGTVDRQRLALYAQDEWTLAGRRSAPRLVLAPGVRLDLDTFFGIYPTPKISLLAVGHEGVSVRASYGRAFRAPSFREMFLLFSNPSVGYRVRGNDGLRPETAWGFTMGLVLRPFAWSKSIDAEQLTVGLDVFDNRLRDAIVVDLVGNELGVDQFSYVNTGQATTRGATPSLKMSLGRYGDVSGSYTYQLTENVETGEPLPGRPTHQGSATLGLRHPHPRWATSGRARVAVYGRRPFFADTDGDDEVERIDTPGFVSLDLRIAQNLTRYVSVFAGVDNVLNAGDPETNPLRPRRFYAGITGRY